MEENVSETPVDLDEKMAEAGTGIEGPKPRRGLFKGQLQGGKGKGTFTTIKPDDPTQIHTVPITDIPRPPKTPPVGPK